MSVDKGLPLGFPLWDPTPRRGKPSSGAKGRSRPRGLSIPGPVRVRVCFVPELGSRAPPPPPGAEKMWIPWGGLMVVGKRMELLGRDKQRPRKPEPKPLVDLEMIRKAKSGLSQERNVRLLHRVARILRSSVHSLKETPLEEWEPPEASRRAKAEARASGPPSGPRKQSGAPWCPSSREELRSRGGSRHREEELMVSGGKVKLNEERRRSREKPGTNGEEAKGSKIASIHEETAADRMVVKEFLRLS